MGFPITKIRSAVILAVLLVVAPALSRAELTRVEIATRVDVLNGRAFGNVGPYEKLRGTAHFAVDPANEHNRIIADIDLAPRNSEGKVEFSADLFILKPKDSSRGNGVVFFDIINRGRLRLLSQFALGEVSNDPESEAHFGDFSLLEQGYTLVAVGWQFDVADRDGLVGLNAPIATENGRTITGWMRHWFIPTAASDSFEYVTGYNTAAYPPLDVEAAHYRLTEREGAISARRLIPREEWQFGKMVDGGVVPDVNFLTLKGGFKPGITYEVMYETQNPPVQGLGLAAIRDMASAMKYDPEIVAPGRYAYMYGSSQTGRAIRQIIHEGFTIDEQGRKAFDAAFVNTGGTGEGSFNERFARPNHLGQFTGTRFPIQYRTTTDPVSGKQEGLGSRIPAGLEPKIFFFDTSSEYWDRGRVAAMRHTSFGGTEDEPDAPNVRVFLASGTRHGSGSVPPNENGGQFLPNTLNYRWLHRGLLSALDSWVREGNEPPASRHPTHADGTLVWQRDLQFPAVPGVQWPTSVPGGFRMDQPGPFSALPFLVSALDADGNEVGGIRLPEQEVPLATFTGWQFRSERIGSPRTLIHLAGSYIPFARTAAERESNKDPRLSIEERYSGRTDYLAEVEAVAERLAQERYILQVDIPLIVEQAGRHWDWRMTEGQPTESPD